uniref:hypothetical protein n=1 Tax=Nonomuraea sp. CA-251285 TaxID=3240002 RepID=UPI003F49937B
MATYRYHFFDFATKRHIDTLPVEQAAFGWELGGVGTFTGELPLYADDLPAARVRDAIIPYRTRLFVERGQSLVWGGWLHDPPSYDSASGRVTIRAEESLGYFDRRFMPTKRYDQIDQLEIARDVLALAQAQPGGDMWIGLDAAVLSGRLRDREYSAYDRTPVLSALSQLSEVIDGFEVGVQVGWFGATPQETLLLGYPRLGRALGASGLAWEYDRFVSSQQTLESFQWSPAGIPMATRSIASAETDEGVQLSATADRPDLIADGYPLLEYGETFDGVSDAATLQDHADALQGVRSAPRIAATATAMAQPGLEVGGFLVGDDVLVRISDWRFPPGPHGEPGFIGYLRIVGVDVTPGEEGAESYSFTLADLATNA